MRSPGKIVILGAGPTGLGAAHRLRERGYDDVAIYERNDYPGGLAASFTDEHGFTWDIGGHVQFSHYTYFDELMDSLLPGEWLDHERESWIWIRDTFVPYPFQYNIHRLPADDMRRCLRGAIHASMARPADVPANFHEWILRQFGEGIAELFMLPYNTKTWAFPPSELGCGWMGERVAAIDIERLIFNVLDRRDDVSWGPNNTFRFPERGGTGEIWRRLAARLPDGWIHYGHELTRIDLAARTLTFANGTSDGYDTLISSIPLDVLVAASDAPADLRTAAARLKHSRVHVFGIGVRGTPPPHLQRKCWMYFPEDTSPYFRATVFSNYSPNNVPDIEGCWSLMVEVSESPVRPVDGATLEGSVIQGLVATRLVDDVTDIAHLWRFVADHGYPTPFVGRDHALQILLPALEQQRVYSRGRFGAWKYEVSNQDHAVMQGVEVVDAIIDGIPEETVADPMSVNGRSKRHGKPER